MRRPRCEATPPTRVLVAAVLLPVLFGSLVLWSLGDRVERLDSVPAAVVNLDDPVRTGKGEDRQTVAAGRLLAAGLTSPTDESEQSLGWELTGAEDAEAGLRDGSYYAVVTIPRLLADRRGSVRGRPRACRDHGAQQRQAPAPSSAC